MSKSKINVTKLKWRKIDVTTEDFKKAFNLSMDIMKTLKDFGYQNQQQWQPALMFHKAINILEKDWNRRKLSFIKLMNTSKQKEARFH